MRKLFGEDFFAKVNEAGIKNDENLKHLKELPYLERLDIMRVETPITPAGLEYLKELTKLKWMYVTVGQLTDDDFEELKRALPNCVIMPSYPPMIPPGAGELTKPDI